MRAPRGARRGAAVLATALATTSLLISTAPGVSGAPAAPPTHRLPGSDFPTAAQVAKHYPAYRGGGRDFGIRNFRMWFPRADCVRTRRSAVPVRDSRIATYHAKDGRSPYFRGGTEAQVTVYLYASRRRAAAELARLEAAVSDCWGTHERRITWGPGEDERAVSTATYVAKDMPPLGEDRFAYRLLTSDSELEGEQSFAETWVLDGRVLVNAGALRNGGRPAMKPLVALARTAVRTADGIRVPRGG